MDRETKMVETPRGNKIEIKTYLTGGEMRKLHAIFLKGAELDTSSGEDGKPGVKNIKADSFLEAERKTLELSVVSVNGSKENIVQTLQDLPNDDYQFVINEINKLSQDFLGKGSA